MKPTWNWLYVLTVFFFAILSQKSSENNGIKIWKIESNDIMLFFAEGKSWKLNKNGNPCLRYKLIMLNNAATAMCVMKYFEAIN